MSYLWSLHPGIFLQKPVVLQPIQMELSFSWTDIQRILLGHGFPSVNYLVWYCTILMQNVMGGSVKHWTSVYMALQLPWILYLFQNRSYKNNKNWLAQNWIQISFLNILLPTKHGFILYVLVSNKTNEQCFS